jgi:hypothetical protein
VRVVFHGCETWSVVLREEPSLRVLENRFLRRIFWPKKDKLTGEFRKLHNEELCALNPSTTIVRMVK